jgi:hypothetical protein
MFRGIFDDIVNRNLNRKESIMATLTEQSKKARNIIWLSLTIDRLVKGLNDAGVEVEKKRMSWDGGVWLYFKGLKEMPTKGIFISGDDLEYSIDWNVENTKCCLGLDFDINVITNPQKEI